MENIERIEDLYHAYDLLLEKNIEILWDLEGVQEQFQDILHSLDTVITRNQLDHIEKQLKNVEEEFQEVEAKIEESVTEQDQDSYHKVAGEVEDDQKEAHLLVNEKKEVIDYQETVVLRSSKKYDELKECAKSVDDEVKSHRRRIQEYLAKINQMKAREVVIYRSGITEKMLRFTGRVVRRSVEAKLLSTVVPKKMASLYLASKLVQDAKDLLREEDFVLTRKEADVSYYNEIKFDHASMKNYDDMVKSSLVEVRSLREEYKKTCEGFPDDSVFKENMKKISQLEDVLLLEALEVENVLNDYNQTMDYNEQKVKSLSDS